MMMSPTYDNYSKTQSCHQLGSMPEEDENDQVSSGLSEHGSQEWVYDEVIKYSSPSEIGGDSGVSSEHDTPPPKCRKQHSKRNVISSDSDNDSNASSENNNLRPSSHRHEFARTKNQSRKKSGNSGKLLSQQAKLPDCLLKEIKEKSRELKRKRQFLKGENNDRKAFSRSSSFQRSNRVSRIHHTRTYNSLPQDFSSLSLAESSNYSSSTSLSTEEEDFFPSTFNTRDYRKPLYECKDETASSGFAGLNDIFAPQQESTIRSLKGTVRGVKNRVRAGIATFTSDHSFLKMYAEKERGKVVIYVTTLGVVRETFERCMRLRKILWTLLVRFDERDVFMSRDTQIQLLDRLHCKTVSVPHIFLEGQYLGSIELIEKLNETGELRRILQLYMRPASTTPCDTCGGFRLLPCSVCRGSKKSVHRNNFTLEFVALKCSACDESGLVPCHDC